MSFTFDSVVDLTREVREMNRSLEDLAGLFTGKREVDKEVTSNFEQDLDILLNSIEKSIEIDFTFDELENLIMDVPVKYSTEDEVPGRCSCGGSQFSLKSVQSQLMRTCKDCGFVRWL